MLGTSVVSVLRTIQIFKVQQLLNHRKVFETAPKNRINFVIRTKIINNKLLQHQR